MINIIDVSVAQGRKATGNGIVWSEVARWRGPNGEKIDGAIVKATEGNAGVDLALSENWAGAWIVGLLLGAYHFAHPDSIHANDAADEATHFVTVVRGQGWRPEKGLALALDIEEARQVHKGAEFWRWVLLFCDTVEELTGARCLIYGGKYFLDDELGALDDETKARLARHPLWIAAYVNDVSKFIPGPWKESGQFLHQDSGDIAPAGHQVLHVDGIGRGKVAVDHDTFNGTIEELHARIAELVAGTAMPATAIPVEPGLQLGDGGAPTDPYAVDRKESETT